MTERRGRRVTARVSSASSERGTGRAAGAVGAGAVGTGTAGTGAAGAGAIVGEVTDAGAIGAGTIVERIYAISPSGALGDRARVERAMANLGHAGFPVTLDRAALSIYQRFAGSDATRAAAFQRAAASRAGIVMATRGGYGLVRILDRLDFDSLAASGKRWIGLSDFTAFHLAMLARTRATTWSGPCLAAGFGAETLADVDPTTVGTFTDCMTGRLEALGFECTGPRGFEAEGTLWGGNLAMICALLGTPWFPAVRGGILFIEDTAEHPYRIERMLLQLLHAGVLDRQKAIVFGQFDDYRLAEHDRGFDLPVVIARLKRQTKAAIITGLPFGHGSPCVTLPHGARVGIAVDGRICYLVYPHRH
ncbi:MAG: LD-carboxypeptidase [Burkholderiaceae bacterium]